MILKTDFRRGDAGALLEYIQRNREADREVPLHSVTGRELSEGEVEEFVDRSREHGFERHLIVSPNPDMGYNPQEVRERTQALIREWVEGRPSAKAVYAVHTDTDHPHAHIAATGRERDLQMDTGDIERTRERAREVYGEPDRVGPNRTPEHEQEREISSADPTTEKSHSLFDRPENEGDAATAPDRSPAASATEEGPSADPESEAEPDPEHGPGPAGGGG